MSGFCADNFLDQHAIWKTSEPQLTECAKQTLLPSLPLAFLAFAQGMVALTRKREKKSEELGKVSFVFLLKLLLLLILMANVTFDVLREGWNDVQGSAKLNFFLLVTSYVLATIFIITDKLRGIHTSGPIFLFWLLSVFTCAPTFRSQIEEMVNSNDTSWQDILLASSFFPLVVIHFMLNCQADLGKHQVQVRDPPEENASFASILTFSWLDPLIWRGYKSSWKKEDLPHPPGKVNVQENVANFKTIWSNGQLNIWHAIWKAHWPMFIKLFTCGSTYYGSLFVGPQLLKLLVNHVDSNEEAWKGYFYAVCLFLTYVLGVVIFHTFVQDLGVIGLQLRSCMIGLVYGKSLKLSNQARKQFSSGQIANLISNDCQRMVESFPYLSDMWTSPFTIILSLIFLYLELGVASFAGLAILLLMIPVNIWAGKDSLHLQNDQLEQKDARLKLMNEVLKAIKVLKLHAWE